MQPAWGEELPLAKVCRLMRSRSNLSGLMSATTARLGTCALPYAAASPRAPLSAELLLVLLFARAWLPSQTLPTTYTSDAAGIKN